MDPFGLYMVLIAAVVGGAIFALILGLIVRVLSKILLILALQAGIVWVLRWLLTAIAR